jgi:hypothetical protein
MEFVFFLYNWKFFEGYKYKFTSLNENKEQDKHDKGGEG